MCSRSQLRDCQAIGLHLGNDGRSACYVLLDPSNNFQRSGFSCSGWLSLLRLNVGNSVWAGATAAIMANVVLIAYVVVAFYEDQSEALAAEEDKKAK